MNSLLKSLNIVWQVEKWSISLALPIRSWSLFLHPWILALARTLANTAEAWKELVHSAFFLSCGRLLFCHPHYACVPGLASWRLREQMGRDPGCPRPGSRHGSEAVLDHPATAKPAQTKETTWRTHRIMRNKK